MSSKRPESFSGLPTARGFAAGPVFIYRSDGDIPVPEYVVEQGREGDELLRLKRAVLEAKRDLEGLIAVLRERTGRSDVRVFECHLMILEDAVLQKEIEGYITISHLNAECAVRKTIAGARAQFERMNDPYFRERVRDFDDLERRLLKVLTGFERPRLEFKTPSIIVADDLTPSETVQLPREFVLGFATDGGSATSHTALLARALAIPAVCGLGDITSRVSPGETMLLDGTNGVVTVNPDPEARTQFETLIRRQRELAVAVSAGRPAGALKDGGEVRITANLHPGMPVAGVKEYGARGIGLFRSEYLWLDRELEPTEDEQFAAYRAAATLARQLAPDACAVIRTLDLGGDKIIRGITTKEANPFLGCRSIRYSLAHREVLKTQLRAILRASAFGKTAIMYPMVSCVEEIDAAAAMLAEAKSELAREGRDFDSGVAVGLMIEVPSAALNAEVFARKVDFFSIGTNDLVQYTMAADRGNEAVSHLYQPLNPAVVRLVGMTIDAAHANGIPVGVCGESASDPVCGLFWAALGADSLSMSATFIPVVASLCERLTRADLDEYARVPARLPADATARSIYAACRDWLAAKVPELKDMLV